MQRSTQTWNHISKEHRGLEQRRLGPSEVMIILCVFWYCCLKYEITKTLAKATVSTRPTLPLLRFSIASMQCVLISRERQVSMVCGQSIAAGITRTLWALGLLLPTPQRPYAAHSTQHKQCLGRVIHSFTPRKWWYASKLRSPIDTFQ